MKKSIFAVGIATGLAFATAAVVYAASWVGPTGSPPNSNVSAPINIGSASAPNTHQTKNDWLSVNTLDANTFSVFGNAYIQNNLGIGIASPLAKLDVNGGIKVGSDSTCDNTKAGTIRWNGSQFQGCNGSSWGSLGSSSGITSCRVCTRFQYEWYGYRWSAQGCSAYSSGNTLQTADSGGGYGYAVQVETSIQCQ